MVKEGMDLMLFLLLEIISFSNSTEMFILYVEMAMFLVTLSFQPFILKLYSYIQISRGLLIVISQNQ